MKRMIIDVVRRLAGGKLAQQATQTRMSAAGQDVARGEVSLCQRKGTLVPTIGNHFAIGLAPFCYRLGTVLPSAWHAFATGLARLCHRLGTASFSPHLALRSLLLITMILGGVLESGAVNVSTAKSLRSELSNGTSSIVLTKDIPVDATNNPFTLEKGDVTIDLNGYTLKNGKFGLINYSTLIIAVKGGTLTIIDSKGTGKVNGGSASANTVQVTGGTLIVKANIVSELQTAIVINGSSARVELHEGANVETTGGAYRAIAVENGALLFKGGTIKSSTSSTVKASNKMLSEFVEQGYGIYSNNQLADMSQKEIGGTLTVAPIQYKFNYHTNGGSVADYTSVEYYTIENKNISFLPINIGTKAGYQFTGEWYYESNFTTKVTASNLPFPTTDVVDVYAKWTPASYTIQFNSQGGSPIADESYTIETSVTLKNGSNYVDRYVPVYAYRTFQGWYEDVAGNGAEVTIVGPGQTGDLTLYAKWLKDTYTIKYDYNGGAAVAGGNYPETYQVGDDITIGAATHEINRFGGWKDRTLQKVLENNKLPSSEPSNLDLVVIWDVPYTITFKTGFPDVAAPAPITTFVSEPKELPSVSRQGYTFKGWKDAEGNIHAGGKVYNGDADVTLTAEW